ncbi:TaqI family restriction endonuclease [Candidatus Saccharibacteria bacterium]|nr:TaqI family restriction endonuclease [Candidatus Saccharibacteria bacterium]
MDLNEYEKFLSGLKLDHTLFRIKTVEANLYGDLNPGKWLDILFFQEKRWLGFEDFLKFYIKQNWDLLHEYKNLNYPNMSKEEFLNGIRARLYRTQFGFLTEYHAFLLSKKVFGNSNVTRDFSKDRIGVDFQISHLGITYNIHIFVDSPRSWYYRNIKSAYRNVDSAPGIHVNLPYSLSQGKINSLLFLDNGFGIYREEYLLYLKHEMEEHKLDRPIVGVSTDSFIYG